MVSSGYLSLLYSISDKPLEYWCKQHSQTGRVCKTLDSDLLENIVELQDLEKSSNGNTFIGCPASPQQLLDIRLPFLVIVMKNMNVECRFQVQIIDTNEIRHHFHFSNEGFENNGSVRVPVISRVDVKLQPGWNRLEIDLEDLTRRAFNSRYKATQRLAIFANCRLRRIYFIDKHYADMEISSELCQAFFHHYMLKWGIHLKEGITKRNDPHEPVNQIRSHFLRDIQIKSGKLINDFFGKTNTSLSKILDFKNKMRLMLFAIPRRGGSQMPSVTAQGEERRKLHRRHAHGCGYYLSTIRNDDHRLDDINDTQKQLTRRETDNEAIFGLDVWKSRYETPVNTTTQEKEVVQPVVTPKWSQRASGSLKKSRRRRKEVVTKNFQESPGDDKAPITSGKVTPVKSVVKSIINCANRKEDERIYNAVISLEGTLNEIRMMPEVQKSETKNGLRKKSVLKKNKEKSCCETETTKKGSRKPQSLSKVSNGSERIKMPAKMQ
ncbi:uncharacterized protein LOC124186028 [Neodiprion fabricii]|uniref:uncharacterized protein LOC124186028 n=1 Tax=Neodiprion fabricii TaxID=2872261 RepID=UPI001ED941DF|nr:uncharacterized protein LOC124186028 [Neodiprion fabricii]